MTIESSTRILGAFLGFVYIGLGIAESVDHRDDNAVFFWFTSLCGGGVLLWLGVFKLMTPAWASIGLVTVGALAGGLAASWTILAPILSITLIVLTLLRTRRAAAGSG